MYLEHFICLLLGMVLASVFHHLYYYNGKIIFDSTNSDKNAFRLCILKVEKLRRRKYVIFKIGEEHYIRNENNDLYD